MKRLVSFLIIMLMAFGSKAQTELQFGSLSASYAQGSSISNNPFAIFANPATASQENSSIGVFVNNRFGIQDFSVLGIAYQTKGISAGFRTSGNQFLAEYNPNISYQIPVTSKMVLGTGLSGFFSRIESENPVQNRSTISGHLGLHYQISETVKLSGLARNFIQSETQRTFKKQEYLGVSLHYQPDSTFAFYTELFTAYSQTLAVRCVINYTITPTLSVRYGVITNPFSNHLGISLRFGSVDIIVAASYQNTLGFSPDVGAVYAFPSTNKSVLDD